MKAVEGDQSKPAAEVHETHTDSLMESVLSLLWSLVCMPAMLASLITGVLALLFVAALMAILIAGPPAIAQVERVEGGVDVLGPIRFLATMWGGVFAVFAAISFPMTVAALHRRRQWEAWLEEGWFVVSLGRTKKRWELSTCSWRHGYWASDGWTSCLPWEKRIVISKHQSKSFVVGATPQASVVWADALARLGVPRARPFRPEYALWACGWRASVGLIGGVAVGALASFVAGDSIWIVIFCFLAGGDGAALGLYRSMAASSHNVRMAANATPSMMALGFGKAGLIAGAMGGAPGLLVGLLGNSVAGWFAGKQIQRWCEEASPQSGDSAPTRPA